MERTISRDSVAAAGTARRTAPAARTLPRPPRAPSAAAERQTWKSSLCASDLACLLQVIETNLLPRLLREYRPGNHAPLKASRSG